jgi:hypothetical protein
MQSENILSPKKDYLQLLETEATRHLQHFKIKEGNRNMKIQKKRYNALQNSIDILGNLTFLNWSDWSDPDRPIRHTPLNKVEVAVLQESIYKCYNADIKTKNEPNNIRKGYIFISYFDSQFYARRELAMALATMGSRLWHLNEFSHPKKIGDDLCFKTNFLGNSTRQWIFFIRDYTVFSIRVENGNEIDIEQLARYIDQKFVELNKELNEKSIIPEK